MVNPGDKSSSDNGNAEQREALLSSQPQQEQQQQQQQTEVPMVEIKQVATSSAKFVEQDENSTVRKKTSDEHSKSYAGLSKDELEKFAKDPFWRRVRIVILILFWLVWAAMLAAVVIIIVLSPKCPPRPTRQFWQKPFYRIQVQSFSAESTDDNKDNPTKTGTLKGLQSRLGYLRETLGFDNFIISSLLQRDSDGCVANFKAIDDRLGSAGDLESLTKRARKQGFDIMMEIDLSQAAASWSPGSFVNSSSSADFKNMLNRENSAAWINNILHTPRNSCYSLNVTAPEVRQRLLDALGYWLDRGVSGFVLTNAAFLAPKFVKDVPKTVNGSASFLFSNQSVEFVKSVREFVDSEAGRRAKELALFVDAGDLGYEVPMEKLVEYGKIAHAVINTQLGVLLNAKTDQAANAEKLLRLINATSTLPTFAYATNWPYLRRDPKANSTVLSLTLPGVPIVYYGQEVGMAHVDGVKFTGNVTKSFLKGKESTDASETPMQWSGPSKSAGWLENDEKSLKWVNLQPRADDIAVNNLQRLDASGHPSSQLQLVQDLVAMVTKVESLQWGKLRLLPSPSGTMAFARVAERFPPVVVVINPLTEHRILALPGEVVGETGELKIFEIADPNVASSYAVGEKFELGNLFAPAQSALVFLGE